MAEEELSISTSAKRRTVVIDGVRLDMLNIDELSLDAGVRVRQVREAFVKNERLTIDSARELAAILAIAVRDVLPSITAEVDARLSDTQRMDIMVVFLRGLVVTKEKVAVSSIAELKHELAHMGIGVRA